MSKYNDQDSARLAPTESSTTSPRAHEVTDWEYGEMCDLFDQALFHVLEPDLDQDRMRSTSPQARRYATAVVELLGLTL